MSDEEEERVKYMSSLIRYRCANPAHQRRATTSLSDTMTIYERSWAFCPHDVRSADHTWSLENPDAPVLLVRAPADLPTLG
jgi:hypothetical protein